MTTFFFIYVLLPIFLFLFLYRNRRLEYCLPLVICSISVLSYDSVSDYFLYAFRFSEIQKGRIFQEWEPGYILLNKLFSPLKHGYIYVYGTSLCFVYLSAYKTLKRDNVVLLGFLVLIFLGFINRSENILRQGIAMAIFWQAYEHLRTGKAGRYLALCLIATLFHLSAFVMLIFYPVLRRLGKIEVSATIGGIVMLLALIIYQFDLLKPIFAFTFNFVDKYANYIEFSSSGSLLTISLMVFKAFSLWLPLLLLKHRFQAGGPEGEAIKLAWFSVVLYIIGHRYLLFDRVSEYFIVFQSISYAYLLRHIIAKRYLILFVAIVSPLVVSHGYMTWRYYGLNTLKTVWNEDRYNGLFYVRSKDFGSDDWTDRSVLMGIE